MGVPQPSVFRIAQTYSEFLCFTGYLWKYLRLSVCKQSRNGGPLLTPLQKLVLVVSKQIMLLFLQQRKSNGVQIQQFSPPPPHQFFFAGLKATYFVQKKPKPVFEAERTAAPFIFWVNATFQTRKHHEHVFEDLFRLSSLDTVT